MQAQILADTYSIDSFGDYYIVKPIKILVTYKSEIEVQCLVQKTIPYFFIQVDSLTHPFALVDLTKLKVYKVLFLSINTVVLSNT